MTIWKFDLILTDLQTILMPANASILSVQVQNGSPVIWAMVDPAAPKRPRVMRLVGTGHPVENDGIQFIGTFQMHDGALVFHLFEKVKGDVS